MDDNQIKLTSTSYVVIGLIDILGEATPYDLKQFLEQSVENFWPVPHTTFYAEPTRLASAGYLTEHQEPAGRRRKLYTVTNRGREALREWVHSPGAPPPQLRDAGVLKIFFGADPVPILRERVEWHRAKLAELEGYMDAVRAAGGPRGVELALVGGTTYHRVLLEAVEEFLQGAQQGPGRAA